MENHLLASIQTTLSKSKVEKLAAIASNETFSAKDLVDLSFHHDEQVGFRAAWILEQVYTNHEARFSPYTKYFLDKFPSQRNFSALRHFVKIVAFITKKNASAEIKAIINQYNTEPIVEVVFAWLIDDQVPVAIKSHCLNILANLVNRHGWIRNELVETMEFLVDKESVAFFAKVKQIRKQLL